MPESLPLQESLRKGHTPAILYRVANGRQPDAGLCLSGARTKNPSATWNMLTLATVNETRLENLRHLRDGLPGDDERGKQGEMAEKLGMSESQLSQLIGKNPSKPIGNRLARKIEKKLGLPRGHLDTPRLNAEQAEIARKYQRLTPADRRLIREQLDRLLK